MVGNLIGIVSGDMLWEVVGCNLGIVAVVVDSSFVMIYLLLL